MQILLINRGSYLILGFVDIEIQIRIYYWCKSSRLQLAQCLRKGSLSSDGFGEVKAGKKR